MVLVDTTSLMWLCNLMLLMVEGVSALYPLSHQVTWAMYYSSLNFWTLS